MAIKVANVNEALMDFFLFIRIILSINVWLDYEKKKEFLGANAYKHAENTPDLKPKRGKDEIIKAMS